jgi:hypothetical protein
MGYEVTLMAPTLSVSKTDEKKIALITVTQFIHELNNYPLANLTGSSGMI